MSVLFPTTRLLLPLVASTVGNTLSMLRETLDRKQLASTVCSLYAGISILRALWINFIIIFVLQICEAEHIVQGHRAIGDKIMLESRQPDPRVLTLHCYL